MQKRTILTAATILLTSIGVATAASNNANRGDAQRPAQQRAHAKPARDGLPHDLQGLNLTNEQKTKIQAIMQQNRPEAAPNREQDRAQREQRAQQQHEKMQQLLRQNTFNEQAARSLIAERQQQRAEHQRQQDDRELQMLRQRHAVFQVLTPAQQQQYFNAQKSRQPREPMGEPNHAPKRERR